jgi:hypothetical protein
MRYGNEEYGVSYFTKRDSIELARKARHFRYGLEQFFFFALFVCLIVEWTEDLRQTSNAALETKY